MYYIVAYNTIHSINHNTKKLSLISQNSHAVCPCVTKLILKMCPKLILSSQIFWNLPYIVSSMIDLCLTKVISYKGIPLVFISTSSYILYLRSNLSNPIYLLESRPGHPASCPSGMSFRHMIDLCIANRDHWSASIIDFMNIFVVYLRVFSAPTLGSLSWAYNATTPGFLMDGGLRDNADGELRNWKSETQSFPLFFLFQLFCWMCTGPKLFHKLGQAPKRSGGKHPGIVLHLITGFRRVF